LCSHKLDDEEVQEDFDILVNSKKLLGFLSSRKEKSVEFVVGNNTLVIKSDSIEASFQLEAMDNKYPQFPSLKEIKHEGDYPLNSLVEGMSFVNEHLNEGSPSIKETLLEIRNNCVVGGSPSSMAVWKDSSLCLPLKLACHESKKICAFLAFFKEDIVSLYESPHHLFFKVSGSNFISCEKLSDEVRVPKIDGYVDKMTPSLRAVFDKKEILNSIKSLKHTIDSMSTEMRLRIGNKDCESGMQVIFGNSSRNLSTSNVEAVIDPESDEKQVSIRLDYKIFTEALKYYKKDKVILAVYRLKSLLYLMEEDEESGTSSEILIQLREIS
jgi:DNA polymerase III sliding clamp (beta) subunit (PCNA family)